MQRQEASSPIMNKTRESGVQAANTKPVDDMREKSDNAVQKQEEEAQSGQEQNPKQQTKNDIDHDKSSVVQDRHEEPQSGPEQNPKQKTKNDVEELGLSAATDAVDFLPFRRSVVETDTSLE